MAELADLTGNALKLGGVANRKLRFLIHRCRRTLVAIPGYGVPILRGMLPLAVRSQGVLDALLTLSDRLRHSDAHMGLSGSQDAAGMLLDTPNQTILDNYQESLSTLQDSLLSIQSGLRDGEEAIAMSIVLLIFGFPGHRIWSVHLNGLIALIQDPGIPALSSPYLSLQASKLAAHADISAFSLGRAERSQHLWLSWRIHPVERGPDSRGARPQFSEFEVSTAYPESLVTIIALVSVVVEDTHSHSQSQRDRPIDRYIQNLADYQRAIQHSTTPVETHASPHGASVNGSATDDWRATEDLLAQWEPPRHPEGIAVNTSLALATAWSIMRKATFIYLWRRGFDTDIRVPLGADHTARTERFLREALSQMELLMQAAEQHDIMIANALLWPLTVLRNECAWYPDLQQTVLHYFGRLNRHFPIHHSRLVSGLLQEVWALTEEHTREPDATPCGCLCLQYLAIHGDACIPLL
ncbi:hypothetical protein BJY00DRAFT_317838 [Aspergillus carlsbadensis]|nr:hypothetical protein BJY00DRAFT_317838 [Aspergillus carlsbadensis]